MNNDICHSIVLRIGENNQALDDISLDLTAQWIFSKLLDICYDEYHRGHLISANEIMFFAKLFYCIELQKGDQK